MTTQQALEVLRQIASAVWALAGVKIIVAHTVVNLVVALAAAQKTGTIQLSKIGEFLTRKLLPYVAVYAVIQIAGDSAGLGMIGPAVWAMIETSLAGDLIDNLAILGLPIPDSIARFVVKPKPVISAAGLIPEDEISKRLGGIGGKP